jgi:salicylate 5-hydroxylase small subunit
VIETLTPVRDPLYVLYAEYADLLDAGEFDGWLDLFTDNCQYVVTSKENHDRALPLAAMRCDSRAMLADRVRAIQELSVYRSRVGRHVVGLPRAVMRVAGGWNVRTNFAVFESVSGEPATIAATGCYRDVVTDGPAGFQFAEKVCVYDAAVIDTSMVFPL